MKQYLLIDIGGTFIKYSLTDEHDKRKSPAVRFRHR